MHIMNPVAISLNLRLADYAALSVKLPLPGRLKSALSDICQSGWKMTLAQCKG